MSARLTTKELLAKLEQHESICGVKLDNIKKQLDDGQDRFIRLEQRIGGLYIAIVVVGLFNKFL
jgi:hypothetical protein|tara:strand:+ start:2459 stop:2650 length:192 start_codon:yes stop_codon:yes gene_type:complete